MTEDQEAVLKAVRAGVIGAKKGSGKIMLAFLKQRVDYTEKSLRFFVVSWLSSEIC